jgi:SAM-dependent methyltransferase
MSFGPITRCRACGGDFGPVFCDLGATPVANAYPARDSDPLAEPRHPLRAVVCRDCRLVQLDHVLDPSGIFTDYAYFSSVSSSWVDHAAGFAHQMIARLGLGAESLVIEAASNDGYLLKHFVAKAVPCLGVEPAANVADVARKAGVPTETAFLTEQSAGKILARTGKPADLVVANNVLAHVPDIVDFARGLARLLSRGGVLSIEMPHLLSLVDGVQFDTIYHEHYSYWSLLSVEALLHKAGLRVFDVEKLPTHGGSLRVFACQDDRPDLAGLTALRAEEAARGLAEDAFYTGFQDRVAATLQGFTDWLALMAQQGHRIAAYGAAAKGNTFLNAAGVGPGDMMAVADMAASKQGRLLPGSRLPILPPDALLALAPDHIVILPWNIAPEIVTMLRDRGYRGGLWTAVPEMRQL